MTSEQKPKPLANRSRRKTNLKVMISLAAIIILGALGGIIYAVVVESSFYDKDPWANAIPLDNAIASEINKRLSKPLLNSNGTANPDNLKSYLHFTVPEKSSLTSYSNKQDSDLIRNWFAGEEWILNNYSAVNEMLNGTGAELSGTQVIYKNQKYKLELKPKILAYPYDNGDDKYGEVSFQPLDLSLGLFSYQVRFALQLVGKDQGGNYLDFYKTYDFSYNAGLGTGFSPLTVPQLLFLINNQEVKNFISSGAINLQTKNNELLDRTLQQYYSIRDNNAPDKIIFTEEIKNKNNEAFAKLGANPNASDQNLNIKYDSRHFTTLDAFGASLFTNHSPGYSTINAVYQALGIGMPRFSNVGNYDLYDRTTSWNFLPNQMINARVNSYQGYIKELGINSDNIADNVNYQQGTAGYQQYMWGSEHQIFRNQVEIKFLNINTGGANNIVRPATTIFYDQQSYTSRSINFSDYNLSADLTPALQKITYQDGVNDVNTKLNQQQATIQNNVKNFIVRKLNNNHIIANNIIQSVKVGWGSNETVIGGTTTSWNPIVNGAERGNSSVYYQDKVFAFPEISVKVTFTQPNQANITNKFKVNNWVVKDPFGTPKNNLQVFTNDLNLTRQYTTLDGISSLKNNYSTLFLEKAQQWINNNPQGHNNEKPTQQGKDFTTQLVDKTTGRTNGNNLKVGQYQGQITALNSSLSFQGTVTSNPIVVSQAPITAISLSSMSLTTRDKEQAIYNRIKNEVLTKAHNMGLALNQNDFTIEGITTNNVNLTAGTHQITIRASGGDNLVTGIASFNLNVQTIDLDSLAGNRITPNNQTINSSVAGVVNSAKNQLKSVFNENDFGSIDLNNFDIYITDANDQRVLSSTFETAGQYWLRIEIIHEGSKWFRGYIKKGFIVN
ncbi:hypothetical protein SSYRP_v1c03010 [Spiroplasma syrphidicola EA-1]|uniref:Uncharacterized protein n=1 Tax=Spiroplasma syrphidicola EA-1 TaxID=1276229 RepID=R4U3C1_9MOLU|nr:hypothetical protein [Spiroplasma syrphidicola]AGM25897.1 hypothetical protein SSYRP_v1c03010 [Spiroplasma syrphidicola EA-1]